MTESLFNPNIEKEFIIKKILFYGGKLNDWIVLQLSKIPLINEKGAIAGLAIIYCLIALLVIKFQDKIIKPMIKFLILGLLIYLILGFFG